MHCIRLDSFYALLSMYYELTLKLVVDRQTDRPTDRLTDRPTDIATHRAAIAAKNISATNGRVVVTCCMQTWKNTKSLHNLNLIYFLAQAFFCFYKGNRGKNKEIYTDLKKITQNGLQVCMFFQVC